MARNVGYSTAQVVASDGHAPGQHSSRLEAIRVAADAAYRDLSAGKIDTKAFNAFMDRAERDATAERNRRKAGQYVTNSDSAEFNQVSGAFGLKTVGQATYQRNLSPLDLPQHELVNLFEAARRKQPYKATITSKAFSDGSGVGMKTTGAPVAEGAPYPSGLLPPVIQPGLTQELRYEPFIADYLPTVEIDAPSIEFLVHVGNSNAAAVVEELGVKADLGQQWDTQIAVPIKLAALSSASTEVLADFPEFGQWLPRELARAVQDVTTDQIVLGSGSGGQMLGIIGTPNVLTRAYNATTDTSGIDTVLQAVNDIRVGTSKAHANLAAMHPSTWDNLRRTKTTTGALVLSMMDPGSIGALDNLWGIQVVTNTYIPEGTAIVMDTDLACRWFVRQGLTVETNMWGDTFWQTNQVGFRAEMRAVLAVLRPTAISIVTGLFPYSGS